MSRLVGKVAIITGGSGGIGKASAEAFLKEGAKVVLVDLNEEQLQVVKADLDPYGEVMIVEADVTSESDVENYVNKALEHFGKIDIFFNNAGIEGKVAPIVEQKIEDFDQVMAVNVRGVFLGLKHVLRVMTNQGFGSIINTSSVAGLHGSPYLSPYITSKHAIVGLTKAAALEAAGANVRVNSIHPSPVNTRMMRSLEAGINPKNAETARDNMSRNIPLGRYGETTDIAKLVLFLASDDSTFITGAQYTIDGGMGAK